MNKMNKMTKYDIKKQIAVLSISLTLLVDTATKKELIHIQNTYIHLYNELINNEIKKGGAK